MHISHCVFYQFQLGNNARAGARQICAALDVADCTCRAWFKGFGEGDTSLEDRSRPRRPPQFDIEPIKVLIEDNPRLTNREL